MSRRRLEGESRRRAGRSGPSVITAALIVAGLALASCDGSSRRRKKPPGPPPPPPPPQATLVLGHTTFTESATDGRGLRPGGLAALYFDGSTLYVSDASNHRVLMFDQIPTANFASADRVVGQLDLNLDQPNPGGVSGSTLQRPVGIFSDGQILYVCDSQNHRVLVWDAPPTGNADPADHVLGQADLFSNDPDRGAPSPAADSFRGPTNIHSDGQRLYVSDTDNNRILIWDFPIDFSTEGPPADSVLGHRRGCSRSPPSPNSRG